MSDANIGWTLGQLQIQHTSNGVAVTVAGTTELVPFTRLNDLIDYMGSVSVEERRTAFRVPVVEELQETVQARVRLGGRARELTMTDLSLTGCRVNTPRGWVVPPEAFPLGIRYEDNRILLTAEVVRRNPRFIALRFEDSMRDGMLTPPEALVRIQRRLELAWLRVRVG